VSGLSTVIDLSLCFFSSDLCIIKNLDGSKSTFLMKMNISSNYQYCLEFKYLITGPVIDCKDKKLIQVICMFYLLACMNFYGKIWANTKSRSRLFSTFCIPNKQPELIWYSFSVLLPENITMVNKSYRIRENLIDLNVG
jgi:hypothetical protein